MKLSSEQIIEIDEMTFTVRPEFPEDYARMFNYREQLNLASIDASGLASGYYILLLRIISWTGVENFDGTPAECNEVNKQIFFGQDRCTLLNEIARKVGFAKETDEKNLETSQTG